LSSAAENLRNPSNLMMMMMMMKEVYWYTKN
jgi:hypothetical protein